MTFDSLVQDIKDYTERGAASDVAFNRQLPRVINRSEISLADRLKIQGYRDVLQGTLSAQNPTVPKPSGWRSNVTFSVGVGTPATFKTLRLISYEYLRLLSPDPTAFGEPNNYCDYNFNNWIVGPYPDQSYPFEAIIYRLPDLLSDNNSQNYLTQLTPNLLLYECLTNMAPMLKNDARIATWMGLRDEQLKNIDTQEIQKFVDRAQTRTSA
jgi:hypothetical protein